MIVCNIDELFRKLNTEELDPNEVIGYLLGQKITRKDANEHPEILSDFRFLSIHRVNTEDWKCGYCGGLRPNREYKCGYCGAPRKINKPEQKYKDYSDDDSTRITIEDEKVHKMFLQEFFKNWAKSIHHQLGLGDE